MSRTMTTRRPTPAELRQLRQLLHTTTDCWQLRRAEAVVLYAEGWDAAAIAHFVALHPHTVQAYLHAFDRQGLDWVRRRHRGGAPLRITAEQRASLCRLADQSPAVVGLPYGRWSLTKLRDCAVKKRIVKAISREQLRRVLKKGGSISGGSSGSSSAPTPSGRRFCGGSGRSSGICLVMASCCSSTSRWWPSRTTVASAIPRRAASFGPETKRREGSSTCSCSTRSTGGAAGGATSLAREQCSSPDSYGGCDAGRRTGPFGWPWIRTGPTRASAGRHAA